MLKLKPKKTLNGKSLIKKKSELLSARYLRKVQVQPSNIYRKKKKRRRMLNMKKSKKTRSFMKKIKPNMFQVLENFFLHIS